MSSSGAHCLVTDRDIEILTALNRCPLSTSQLLRISSTFERPFTNERRLRERLQQLCEAGWVRRWQYATAGRGAPNYYTLSPLGYRILHGDEAELPSKRTFEAVHIAKQHHTQAHAEFIVHTAIAAHRSGIRFSGFYRENSLELRVGSDALFPDDAFQLIDPEGLECSFFTEIDTGSERIRSQKEVESWERKIRFYDRLQYAKAKRFRVLVIGTRGIERVRHILEAATTLVRDPRRSLFYGISLAEYLVKTDPLRHPCFRDNRSKHVALVPKAIRRFPVLPVANQRLALA